MYILCTHYFCREPFKCYVMQWSVCQMYRVYGSISVMIEGWVGDTFPEGKRYVTLEWPWMECTIKSEQFMIELLLTRYTYRCINSNIYY